MVIDEPPHVAAQCGMLRGKLSSGGIERDVADDAGEAIVIVYKLKRRAVAAERTSTFD